ncbi:polysaccharide pyruvyl transferase family protein [Georgenia alba]|uniref:Polysaccharide pyruvyl transferase family protein n=1 Tax=Georgenia alba TaxID=2233858 RepID=A0ABW2Q6U6_9MICO
MSRGTAEALEIFAWNPRRPVVPGRLGRLVPVRRRVNNFGDLLGPAIVSKVREVLGVTGQAAHAGQLLSVGSVLHFARPGAVVWGSGVNGKVAPSDQLGATDLDVRAVRGPRTREVLLSKGVPCPAIFGDPGILVSELFPELRTLEPAHRVTVVPNLHDWRHVPRRAGFNYLNPTRPLGECLRTIAASEVVVGSSLHGIVVAESLGKPASLLRPGKEDLFKYDDYYRGTGREQFDVFDDPRDAAKHPQPSPVIDKDELLRAFPVDLWR